MLAAIRYNIHLADVVERVGCLEAIRCWRDVGESRCLARTPEKSQRGDVLHTLFTPRVSLRQGHITYVIIAVILPPPRYRRRWRFRYFTAAPLYALRLPLPIAERVRRRRPPAYRYFTPAPPRVGA